ncbi:glutathione S-transferase [Motiliproteus sp. MSK22-1]|nr:glutathione S-transferase [Motiliproteus sp. MSK22-1]
MKLIGSTTSPFVRRLRLWLQGVDYEFVALNIFEGEGREALKTYNPVQKVPALIDGEQEIYDSRVIFRYLSQKFEKPSLSWDEENSLTVIDAANDSFVSLLLLSRSGVPTDQDGIFFTLQQERIKRTLTLLDEQVGAGKFKQWDYPAICLFCMIDWVMLRELCDFSVYPDLLRFRHQCLKRDGVENTDPRKG